MSSCHGMQILPFDMTLSARSTLVEILRSAFEYLGIRLAVGEQGPFAPIMSDKSVILGAPPHEKGKHRGENFLLNSRQLIE